VDRIVQAANPEKVILFGSQARGESNTDSDIDLLIVEEEAFNEKRSRRQEMVRISQNLAQFRVPIDLFVYSRDEVQQWQKSVNHVLAREIREGKVLYERY